MRLAGGELNLALLAQDWAERNEDLFEMEGAVAGYGQEGERMREAMRMRISELMRLKEEGERPRDIWERNNRREESPFV